jgi:hypothetical protein
LAQDVSPAKKKSRKDKHDPESKKYSGSAISVNDEINAKALRKERKALKKARKLEASKRDGSENTVQSLNVGDIDIAQTNKPKKAELEDAKENV